MVSIRVSELKGVTTDVVSALHAIGIEDAQQLLAATGEPASRAQVAASIGIDEYELLELANRADLTRIHGLTCENVELLVMAGVDRVTELRRRIPENLYVRLLAIATQRRIQRIVSLEEVRGWVNEAKQLERVLYF
jgi:hypothetical protein